MPRNKIVKAYNMAILSDDNAEINMYGDVVSRVPRDWHTNERMPGFIGLDEFLEDIEQIKDKSNITVHINSGGGDLYAGLAIYNRLKALKGKVTTINDGMAASAASLIFQAGDVRQMNAGSNLMAHGVSGFLFGYYNIDDLKEMVTQFKAHNKALVNVYAEAMGVSYDEAKSLIDGETWLTGQEAVDKGLADEVIEAEPIEPDNSFMGRIMQKARNAYNPAIAAVTPIADIITQNSTGGTEEMAFSNVQELRAAHPDLVSEIENAATQNAAEQTTAAVLAERQRIAEIDTIANSIADTDLVNAAKYGDKPMTAQELAFEAMKAQSAIGNTMLASLDEDGAASGTDDVNADPNSGADPVEETEEEAKNFMKSVVALAGKGKEGK